MLQVGTRLKKCPAPYRVRNRTEGTTSNWLGSVKHSMSDGFWSNPFKIGELCQKWIDARLCWNTLAGAYFGTDFGRIFTISLTLFPYVYRGESGKNPGNVWWGGWVSGAWDFGIFFYLFWEFFWRKMTTFWTISTTFLHFFIKLCTFLLKENFAFLQSFGPFEPKLRWKIGWVSLSFAYVRKTAEIIGVGVQKIYHTFPGFFPDSPSPDVYAQNAHRGNCFKNMQLH